MYRAIINFLGRYFASRSALASSRIRRWEPNASWTAEYVESDEIEKYFTRMFAKYNVGAFTTFGAEIEQIEWKEEKQVWEMTINTPEGRVVEETHAFINGWVDISDFIAFCC